MSFCRKRRLAKVAKAEINAPSLPISTRDDTAFPAKHTHFSSWKNLQTSEFKMKKVFGMINKKKGDDSDEEWPSYTDPAVLHATDPPSRNSRGILQPHYPPPRPCHSGNSPNPRRKNPDTAVVQGNKKSQLTENNRNSALNLVPGEPKRAPPRINITKKVNRLSKFSTTYIF